GGIHEVYGRCETARIDGRTAATAAQREKEHPRCRRGNQGERHRVLYIGTSGWQYRDWREAFYPKHVPQADWLDYFACRFATVEVNNTFYRLPSARTFATWCERTPPDFRFTVKLSRYLTHIRRLQEPEEAVERFFHRAEPLRDKLGPVLLQLPPTLPVHL